jgi:hypothetical protein
MNTGKINRKSEFQFTKLVVPLVVMLAFWTLAIALWRSTGYTMPLFMFGYIGLSVGLGWDCTRSCPRSTSPKAGAWR